MFAVFSHQGHPQAGRYHEREFNGLTRWQHARHRAPGKNGLAGHRGLKNEIARSGLVKGAMPFKFIRDDIFRNLSHVHQSGFLAVIPCIAPFLFGPGQPQTQAADTCQGDSVFTHSTHRPKLLKTAHASVLKGCLYGIEDHIHGCQLALAFITAGKKPLIRVHHHIAPAFKGFQIFLGGRMRQHF